MVFDYIIVGGSARSVLANRLSKISNINVYYVKQERILLGGSARGNFR